MEALSCEIRMKNYEDEYKWILTNIVPRTSDEGKFIGVLGVGLDITERKEIETKLLESETQFTEITSVIGDGIFMIDSEWNLKFANPEFTNLLGYKEEELENKNIHDIIHRHDDKENGQCTLLKVFEEGETLRVAEDYFVTKHDHLLPVSYVVSPLKRNDNIVGCVVAFHDITERIQSQDEMRRFVEELQFNKELMEENANEFARLNEMLGESESRLKELNASKDKFFSIISHDLRSPFTSIIGFAEVLLEDLDTLEKEDIKEFTNSIYKSSKNIQNLLENLLQWSRVQTGRIEFNPIQFDLNNLVNDVVALYQVNAARKKITLHNNIENNYSIKADKFMIDTVLRNLVSNSIKFTPQGEKLR
jgi:PAS domain S-box-containing protein